MSLSKILDQIKNSKYSKDDIINQINEAKQIFESQDEEENEIAEANEHYIQSLSDKGERKKSHYGYNDLIERIEKHKK